MSQFWKIKDGSFLPVANVNRLGFALNSERVDNNKIPIPYLLDGNFILLRTCLGFGDWVIISALPKLLKLYYPQCKIYLPSTNSLHKLFKPLVDAGMWKSWKNPYSIPDLVFKNNPYIDGKIDINTDDIFHDHYRIYNTENNNEMLIQQILRFWRIDIDYNDDLQPTLYFDADEIKNAGAEMLKVNNNISTPAKSYNCLLLSDRHNYINNNHNKKIIDTLINDDKPVYYYSSKPIKNTLFATLYEHLDMFDIKPIDNIRTQLIIRKNANINIGTQSGITDALANYTNVISLKHTHEHFKTGNFNPKITYL